MIQSGKCNQSRINSGFKQATDNDICIGEDGFLLHETLNLLLGS